MEISKLNGTYVLNNDNWFVRYKIEDGDEQYFEDVMLHPNCNQYAKENKTDWFTIRDCPNLANGGEWEKMAIVINREHIRGLNEHVMSALQQKNK
jgi:hypothetical protein